MVQKTLNILLLIIIFLITIDWWTNHYQSYLFEGIYHDHFFTRKITDDYSKIKNILKNTPLNNANLIVVHNNEERILKFLGHQAFSLVNIEGSAKQKSSTQEVDLEKAILPCLKKAKNNYFIRSWHCDTLPSLQKACDFIENNYSLELIKNFSETERIYLFTDF